MKLEAAGWKIGSVDEFLELSQAEVECIELKLSLSQNLKERRQSLRLTQKDFAKIIHSSQSRVAKMEAGSSRPPGKGLGCEGMTNIMHVSHL